MAGPGDVYAAGSALLRWDGARWQQTGSVGDVRDVWATAAGGWVVDYAGVRDLSSSGGTAVYEAGGLQALWGRSSQEAWVVGEQGAVVRWNGESWSPEPAVTDQTLTAVHGNSDTVWVVGRSGVTAQRTSSGWTLILSGTSRHLHGVWVAPDGKVLAVGNQGVVLINEGLGWQPVTSGTTRALMSVHGTSASDAWIVGALGTMLHWDGVQLAAYDSGTEEQFTSVHALEGGELWLGGQSGAAYHHPGPATSTGMRILTDVMSLSRQWMHVQDALVLAENDVWLVGVHGMVRHFDGQRWQTFDVDTIENINSIHGVVPDDLWIVGDHGVVRHWNGLTWTAVDAGSNGWLSGVYARAANDVWVVGDGVLHFDGQNWRDRTAEIADWWGGTSVYVAGPGDVWISSDGVVYHLRNGSWSDTRLYLNGFESVWWSISGSGNDVWMVGDAGMLRYYDGQWHGVLGSYANLRDVWVPAPGEAWAVGSGVSRVRRCVGEDNCSFIPVPTEGNFFAISGAANRAWVAGDKGALAHWDGTAWIGDQPSTMATVRTVFGSSPSDVWMGGGFGGVLHYDGTALNPETLDGARRPIDGHASETGTPHIVTSDGSILRREGTTWSRRTDAPAGASFMAVWSAGNDVWATTTDWRVMHGTPDGWTLAGQATPKLFSTALSSIHGLSANEIWAVWDDGAAMSIQSNSWDDFDHTSFFGFQEIFAADATHLFAVDIFDAYRFAENRWLTDSPDQMGFGGSFWGWSPTNVLLASGSLWRWDGTQWQGVPLPFGFGIMDLWGASPDDVWLVGAQGLIMRGQL